jgi:NAD(P)-dependent dehydrogenase (short-subunit alcohol dehydrogenase family)
MNSVSGRTAIITGAAGGIGHALCRAFSGAGYFVIASDQETAGEVMAGHAYVPADLDRFCADEHARTETLVRIRDAMAGRELAVLINNAALQIVKPAEQLTVEDWSRTINVNLIAPFLLIQALLPELEAAKGCVINIGSIHAALTKPKFAAYATSKSALIGLTRSLAVELGRRIRVNAINPAAIATPMLLEGFAGKDMALSELEDMHPVGRIGEPGEVATLALFLASDDARFINGAEIGLDGGIRARLHDPV